MSAELTLHGARCRILGTAQGLVAEADRVHAALEGYAPTTLALGIAPDDLPHLQDADADADLAPSDAAYLHGLAHYGPVQLPPPDLVAAHAWARAHDRPVHGLDLPDAEYADALLQNVRPTDLMRDGLRRRNAPLEPDAYAYCRAWTAHERETPAWNEMHHEREGFMADRLRELLTPGARVLAILDIAHMDGVLQALEESPYL